MVPNLFLLIYAVSGYAFSNNFLVYEGDKKEFQKALLWTVLISLAFTFDLLTSMIGLLSVSAFTLLLLAGVYLKRKVSGTKGYVLAELFNFSIALAFTIPLSSWISSVSYLRPPFVNYILGLTVVSVVFMDVLKRLGFLDKESGDSDGNFERILLFIFVMAGQVWYTCLTIAGMIVYRYLRYRKPSKMWIISPVGGILISLLWALLMHQGWI